MRKIAEILKAKASCEEDITAERKKSPSVRDKAKVRKLQAKFKSLTKELSQAHEADRITAVDKSDKSEGEHKEKTEKERQKKVDEWEKKQNEEQSSKKKD